MTISRSTSGYRTGLTCIGLMLISSLTACSKKPEPAPAPARVAAVLVQSADSADTAEFPAQLQARYNSDLSFRVPGKIIDRRVHVGDRVHKGQLLARLDAGDAQQQMLSARAALQAAEHRLSFARQQLLRDQAQMQQDLISKVQLEQTEDNHTAAEAARNQAAAQLALQGNNLQYNQLVADHDGLITAESAETGAVLAAGQALYRLAWTPELDVLLDVSTSELSRWPRGQQARLQLPELPGVSANAQVREIAGHEDSLSGSYRIKLTLLHPDARLRPGMSVNLAPLSAKPGTSPLLLPASALFHQGENPAVWVIRPDNRRLELRVVKVSEYRSNQVLISSGVRAGEQIVQAGVHNVHQGQQVEPGAPPSVAINGHDGQEPS
jgi:multidrug efflux system membrane fusion protein